MSTAGDFVIPMVLHLLYLKKRQIKRYKTLIWIWTMWDLQPAELAEHISIGDILQRLAVVAGEDELVLLELERVDDGAVASLILAFP